MKYSGIDLHSNNSVVTVTDEEDRVSELRGIANLQSKAAEHHHSSRKLDISTNIAPLQPAGIDRRETAGCSPDYHPEEEHLTSLRMPRWLYRHPDIEHIARHRRENYQRWAAATMNLPYCRPLFPELPAGCIPYMFPLLIDHPETDFYWLKRLGVPIWRWDSIVASSCTVANDYRLHLLHLPCHQSLADNEMAWMIAAVQKLGAGGTASRYN